MNAGTDEAWRVLEAAELVLSADDVLAVVDRMARDIANALADRMPVVLAVMRGSVVFAGHLLPRLHFPLEFDYLDVTRYGSDTVGGALDWKVSPGTGVAGRTVLVVDDILDEGHTLAAVRSKLLDAGASPFYSAVFARKETGRTRPIEADFTGIVLPNRYVFGFGMDARGLWRNLPGLYALREE
jgi:hypoxanthine phosphoribosyltransferase